jgi:Flp pilus assembly protein TadD
MIGSQERGGTAGFSLPIPWWAYALRQFQSVLEYLRLIVWPHPLIFDAFTYNSVAEISENLWEVIPSALVIVPLLAATAWAVWKRPALGFLGAWFFVILTPSSSVVPVTDLVWEHRVYLSLAAPVVLGLAGLMELERKWRWHRWIPVACLVLFWGALSAWRNLDYRSAFALWSRNISRVPENAASHNNLGLSLLVLHRRAEAEAEFRETVRLNPSLIVGHSNLGDLYLQEGRNAEAIEELQIAVRLQPGNAEIHTTLGGALLHFGQPEQADRELAEALRLRPGFPLAWYELGNLRLRQGRVAEAAAAYQKVLQGNPDDPRAHNSLGVAFAQLERLPEAEAEFRASLRLDPINPNAHYNLGNTLALLNRRAEAAAEFRETLRLAPAHAAARAALEQAEGANPRVAR